MCTRFLPVVLLSAALASVNAAAENRSTEKSGRRVATIAYQGRNRGAEQSDRVSRKIKLARNGSVSVSNISGDIIVTAGSGDEVSIEAVKHWRGDRGQLEDVRIDINEAPSRVDVRTNVITTVAGSGKKGYSGDGGPATEATLNEPYSIAIDMQGNLFIVDRLNACIRRVDAGSKTSRSVSAPRPGPISMTAPCAVVRPSMSSQKPAGLVPPEV